MTTQSKAKTAAPEEPKAPQAVKTSSKAAEFGDKVIFHGPHGPALALVTTAGTGEVSVLVLTDGEVPRVRSVGLYDTAQDAAEATAVGAVERRPHAAYWPA